MRLRFYAVVALQIAALLGVVASREYTLHFGRTVVLATRPLDPRDPVRGDFVRLRYDISTVSTGGRRLSPGSPVWVLLRLQGGLWSAAGVEPQPPQTEGLWIRGTVRRADADSADVEYGIERYYVAEGEARRIEHLGAQHLRVEVAVDRWGRAAVRQLLID